MQNAKLVKKKYKVKGMDCTSCAMLIEGELEDAGAKASCNYASENLEVEFDPQKLDEEQIRQIVKEAGYDLI